MSLALGVLLGGCGVPPPTPPNSAYARAERLQPVSMVGYLLEPGDDIEIAFAQTPELNVHQIIRPDGSISLIGTDGPTPRDLDAANLSVGQLRETLASVYRNELKDPQITVTVRAFGSNIVYVTGEVGHPGAVPIASSMTVLQAIAAAEGFKSSARTSQILVIRRSALDRASWQIVNLDKSFRSPDQSEDVVLAPHDIVYVPRSPIGNVGEFVDLYIRKVLPIQPGINVPVQ